MIQEETNMKVYLIQTYCSYDKSFNIEKIFDSQEKADQYKSNYDQLARKQFLDQCDPSIRHHVEWSISKAEIIEMIVE